MIARKVPVLEELEDKLKMMHSLHPRLGRIVDELNDITNMDDLAAAKGAGKKIKRALKNQARH